MLSINFPATTTSLLVNTWSTSKIVYLPAVSTIGAGKFFYIKDICGNAANSSIYISTKGFDKIDQSFPPSTLYGFLSTNFGSVLLAPDGGTNWMVLQNYTMNGVKKGLNGILYGVFHLAPTGTFPTYTGTTPTFGASYITFNGSSQYIDFGSKVFNLGTLGFSLKVKISWNSYNNWSRVIDFNAGANGVQDMFLTLPGSGNSPLRFQYKENGAEQVTDWGGTISLNTVYTIAVVYNPNVGGTSGQTKMFVNGTLVVTNTAMSYKGTDKTYTYTYVGRSSYGGDAYLGVNIYSLDVFNYALTDAQALL